MMTMTELLTDTEKEALRLSGQLANLLREICMEPYRQAAKDGLIITSSLLDIGNNDWSESATMIHAIQRQIMGQAAARAYPNLCRLLGGHIQ